MKTLFAIVLLSILINANMAMAAQPPSFETAFSPDRGATSLLVKTIQEAHKTIRVAAYSFTSHPIAEALIQAHNHGVDVEIVMDESNRTQTYSALKFLKIAGVPARTNDHYAIMHNKFMIIDNKTLELGSFNFTKAAEERNAENILVIKNAPEVVANYGKEWASIWEEAAHPLNKEAQN